MNKKQESKFTKELKKATNQHLQLELAATNTPAQQEAAWNSLKEIMRDADIPVGAAVIDEHMTDAVKAVKELWGALANLQVKKPAPVIDATIALDKNLIAFVDDDHDFADLGQFSFMGDLNQGRNNKSIRYTVKPCGIGLAVAHEPILNGFFASTEAVSSDVRNTEKELRALAQNSLKNLPVGDSTEKTRYNAAGRMEVCCTPLDGGAASNFFIISCGQNCDKDLSSVGQEYHGEAFIYGAFLAMLKILDFERFLRVSLKIDYKASTAQSTACHSCSLLIPVLRQQMLAVEKVDAVQDNY
ncbi:MAG: hypothetical protein AAF515_12765 [Pseudomonadota bacterium]